MSMDAPYWNPAPYCRVLYGDGSLHREGRVPFWALMGSPERGGTVLTGRAGPYGKRRGSLRGWVPSQRRTTKRPYGNAPYGEASYGKAPYGKASYGRHLQLQESLWEGWALTGNPLQGGTVLTGRAGHYRRVLYGDGSLHRYDEEAYEKAGPLRAGGTVLTGRGLG